MVMQNPRRAGMATFRCRRLSTRFRRRWLANSRTPRARPARRASLSSPWRLSGTRPRPQLGFARWPTVSSTQHSSRRSEGPDLMTTEARASILVVDDTVENLRLLVSILGDRGYEPRPVTNGSDALRAAE